MALMRPDPTSYPSPGMALQAPAERPPYIALLNNALAWVGARRAGKARAAIAVHSNLHRFSGGICNEVLSPGRARSVSQRHGRRTGSFGSHSSEASDSDAGLWRPASPAYQADNAQAQQFFDQGLRQIYAFNHDEAARSFQRAADLDPKLAMAYWGVAEAVGPNYNDPASDDRFAAAHTAIQKAVDLSGSASPAEQAYIKAMALRFPADPKADRRQAAEAYHRAMREVVKQFPDDLDAATLFAESGMNLHPWGFGWWMEPRAKAPKKSSRPWNR